MCVRHAAWKAAVRLGGIGGAGFDARERAQCVRGRRCDHARGDAREPALQARQDTRDVTVDVRERVQQDGDARDRVAMAQVLAQPRTMRGAHEAFGAGALVEGRVCRTRARFLADARRG